MPDLEAAMYLRDSRDKIANGWTKGTFHKIDSRKIGPFELKKKSSYCLVGALGPYSIDPIRIRAIEYVYTAVYGFGSSSYLSLPESSLIGWNDAAVRTKKEVLGALDKAILMAMTYEEPKIEPLTSTLDVTKEVEELVNSLPEKSEAQEVKELLTV